MKLIISGSRDFEDYPFFADKMDALIADMDDLVILVGDCKTGVDKMVLDYCFNRRIIVRKYHAAWKEHGKSAGPLRNKDMVKDGEYLIAFRKKKGPSPGTDDCIQQARKAKLKVKVIYC